MKKIRMLVNIAINQMKQSLGRAMFRYVIFVHPIMLSLVMFGVYYSSGSKGNFSYTFIGAALLSLWSSVCFSSAGDILRERYSGTLEIIFCAPFGFRNIMLGKIIGNTVLSSTSILISYLFTTKVLLIEIKIGNYLGFFFSLILGLISFIALGLLLSAIFALSRKSRLLMNIMEYPIYILTGILFPIDNFPIIIQKISYMISLTWVVKMIKLSMYNVVLPTEFYTSFMWLLILVVVYSFSVSYIYKVIDKKVRINGSLGVV